MNGEGYISKCGMYYARSGGARTEVYTGIVNTWTYNRELSFY